MAETTNEYKDDLAKVKKECAGKISTLKKDFHKTRDQYLKDRKAQEEKLLNTYNQKINPIKSQEQALINQIEPLESNNFAKNK